MTISFSVATVIIVAGIAALAILVLLGWCWVRCLTVSQRQPKAKVRAHSYGSVEDSKRGRSR